MTDFTDRHQLLIEARDAAQPDPETCKHCGAHIYWERGHYVQIASGGRRVWTCPESPRGSHQADR